MIIKWKIKYPVEMNTWSHDKMPDFIMPELGLKKKEYSTYNGIIDGRPSSFALVWFISPIRISVYDILLKVDGDAGILHFKIRLYKLYVLGCLFVLFQLLIGSVQIKQHLAAFLLPTFFFGILTLIELAIRKHSIQEKIRKHTDMKKS